MYTTAGKWGDGFFHSLFTLFHCILGWSVVFHHWLVKHRSGHAEIRIGTRLKEQGDEGVPGALDIFFGKVIFNVFEFEPLWNYKFNFI